VFEAIARESSLELSASANAFPTHHEVAELSDASIARRPVVLFAFIAQAIAYRAVRCGLNFGEICWEDHRSRGCHSIQLRIPD